MDSTDALSRSRCRERRLNNITTLLKANISEPTKFMSKIATNVCYKV